MIHHANLGFQGKHRGLQRAGRVFVFQGIATCNSEQMPILLFPGAWLDILWVSTAPFPLPTKTTQLKNIGSLPNLEDGQLCSLGFMRLGGIH